MYTLLHYIYTYFPGCLYPTLSYTKVLEIDTPQKYSRNSQIYFLQMDLSSFITKAQCECLNESDDHNFLQCLSSDDGYLESECDEQLILSIAFSQAVKVHSLKIKAPKDKGPKSIKLFINQPRTIDFDMADSNTSIQDLT